MLSSILPGIREIRTPLAAGYLWIAALFAAFSGYLLADPPRVTGLLGDIYELGERIGPGPSLVAMSFAAYLLGSVWEAIILAIVVNWTRADRKGVFGPLRRAIEERVRRRLDQDPAANIEFRTLVQSSVVMIDPARDGVTETSTGSPEQYIDDPRFREEVLRGAVPFHWVRATVDDLERAPTRLLGKEPEVWSAWDRLRAESEFRIAVPGPLAALAIVVSLRVSPWFLTGLFFCSLLAYLGFRKRVEANKLLADAVRAGRVENTYLERIASTLATSVEDYARYPVRWEELDLRLRVRVVRDEAGDLDYFNVETLTSDSTESRDLRDRATEGTGPNGAPANPPGGTDQE